MAPKRQAYSWWRGARGEWYVAAQAVLFALVAWGPRDVPGWPAWPSVWASLSRVCGGAMLACGALLGLAAVSRFGRKLTPLPYPVDGQDLLATGPYRFVRHPMYGGVILMAVGWGLFVQGWLTLAYASTLVVLMELKSRREETWLCERYRGYAAYRRRVRRFVPFVY